MSKFKSDKVMPRYFAIAVVMTLIGFAVVGKAMYIMTAKKAYWTQVADRLKRDSVSVKPSRGNILSCDGQLMASSIPEYKIYVDFQALYRTESDIPQQDGRRIQGASSGRQEQSHEKRYCRCTSLGDMATTY